MKKNKDIDLEDVWAGCTLWVMLTIPVGLLAVHFGLDWIAVVWASISLVCVGLVGVTAVLVLIFSR